MGTTLSHGIYLPDEGERNCYAGLKVNWETLDQKVADISALQSAIAGALHREIVVSLPTTDIDTATIYMILSGTSATENVYNEFMYVNNNWELIGTSATDLTNYYTKAEVDGKLLLKASASDLTSHTGDTTIHVTANDKSKWDTVALIKQLRLVNAQVGSATTIAFANIDDTNGIKVGDKCMDLDGKLFEISAVDTANETVTVGSALIDLALDGNVVHTSGNESVGGVKTFSDDTYIKSLNFTNEVASTSSSSSSIMPIITTVTYYTDQTASKSARINLRITAGGDKSLYPHENNQYALGLTSRKWSEVHATTYYYGSSDVEFSNKFVTTDTAQSISGFKTIVGSYLTNEFSSNARTCVQYVSNADDSSKSGIFLSKFAQGSSGVITRTQIGYDVYSNSVRKNRAFYLDFTDFVSDAPTKLEILSTLTTRNLGNITNKFTSVNTTQINELEPSSLSMPDLSNGIDISSYITIPNDTSTYTPSVNGWISIVLKSTSGALDLFCYQGDFAVSQYGATALPNESKPCAMLSMPVTKGIAVNIATKGANAYIVSAKFYPCQGNV